MGDDELREALYKAYAVGDDQLGQALGQSQSKLTPRLARRIADEYAPAMAKGDMNGAKAAADIASRVYSFLHLLEAAINCIVDSLSILYIGADNEKAYGDISTSITSILSHTDHAGWSALVLLHAFLLAADSAFHAASKAATPDQQKYWIGTSLDALQRGAEYLADASVKPLLPAYTSTAVALYERSQQESWTMEPWPAAHFVTIVRALDEAAPRPILYVAYASPTQEPAKTAAIHRSRCQMSKLFNNDSYQKTNGPLLFSGLFGRKTA